MLRRSLALVAHTQRLHIRSLKTTTGIVGLSVHPDPLPALKHTYSQTLALLKSIPDSAVYRQSVEAVVATKLKAVDQAITQGGKAAVQKLETVLDEGQIEEVLKAAESELSLTEQMIQWKPWEPLAEKPMPGQWTYFGVETRS